MRDFKGTGGQILVECLADHGIKQVTTVAGESYLAVLDALLDHPEIEVITCRQEGGAAYMAEARGKLSGKPGICFVTRGPGACNASIGVHTAMQDSTPMILFMGQVARADKGREAFQEIDVPQIFGGLAKWATEITDPARISETINRAFKVALSGRPGPVVISLPEDMLTEMATAHIHQPVTPINAAPAKEDIHALQELLRKATNPVILVGGHGWDNHDCEELARFASKSHIPVVASFRRQDLIDHRQKCYVGELGTGPNPALVEKLHHADLWVVVGARLNEITTQGYKLPALNS
ncbi:MAG: thiamine pyrophosphate-binding protein, partial [Pseudomonadota bacterium]|nr:thiamine pyrophosphate-binding protein [Pseudomonadota bacterium]